ncbi:MAG: bifunctional glycosyltransferase family 2/GtrA family protein [Oscillospiraceae bacterium]|nr:bifunctional glycosyltransferase family 2/GtrA family protein [Oscillospiraceae bacterium]
MLEGQTRIALIPAYEPEDRLLNLVVQLTDAHFRVIVVDDGSGESYRHIFSAARRFAEVLIHETNKGKGEALKTGLSYIQKHCPEDAVIVTLDADGQHSAADAVRVTEAVAVDGESLVLGCRRFYAGVPKRSYFGNSVTRFVYRTVTGLDVSDTQTGLRAFRTSLIPFMLKVSGDRYEYEMNVLLKCARSGIPIKEIEISTIYFDNNEGSHFSTFRDSFIIYREIAKFAASSLTGFAVDYGLYSILAAVTAGLGGVVGIPLSNITARIVSSSVNYTINRRFVFKSRDNAAKTAVQYFTLAACILAANTVLLSVLVIDLGMNEYAAKIITEVVFFAVSWLVQRFFIFAKKPENTDSQHIAETN